MPKGLDIARAFHASGWRVIVAEPFSWHVCRASRAVARCYTVTAPNDSLAAYHQEILEIIEREHISLIVPISEEAMHLVPLMDHLPAGVRMLSSSADQVRQVHDKLAFVRSAAALGLSVPTTEVLGTTSAAQLANSQDTVLKPTLSCSGSEVKLHNAGVPLPQADADRQVLVQQRLFGAHRSTLALARQGRVLGNVIYRGTLFTGSVAAAFERIEAPDVEAWVQQFVSANNWTGFIAFDFIDDENGVPHAIECNPRLTSGVHFITRDSLSRALTDEHSNEVLEFRSQTQLHQFYTSLTETQSALLKPRRMLSGMKVMWTHTDVTWSLADPLPFLLMTPLSLPIIWRSLSERISLGEAATRDIARTSHSS